MPWTAEQKVEWMLRQPWRIRVEREDDGSYFARVDGLEGAVADGATPTQLQENFWESLRITLRAYLDAGDRIPLPGPLQPPWDAPLPRDRRLRAQVVGGTDLSLTDPATSLGGAPVAA